MTTQRNRCKQLHGGLYRLGLLGTSFLALTASVLAQEKMIAERSADRVKQAAFAKSSNERLAHFTATIKAAATEQATQKRDSFTPLENRTVSPNLDETQALERTMRGDPTLEHAVTLLLSDQLSAEHRASLARFQVVEALTSLIASNSNSTHAAQLRVILEDGYRVNSLQQLQENENLARIIHGTMVRAGTAPEFEFERSEAYKRMLRRRLYLTALKKK